MLRRLPVAAPSELVRADVVPRDQPDRVGNLSYGMVSELLAAQRTLVDLSGWRNWQAEMEEPMARGATFRLASSLATHSIPRAAATHRPSDRSGR